MAMLSFHKYLPPCFTPLCFAFTSSVYRLLSSAPLNAPPSSSRFAVDYLTKSLGLTSGQAIRAAKHIVHLKSTDKPDDVLQFLRHAGITESYIRSAALRNSRFLCIDVEKTLKPWMAKLQEIGFSRSQISLLLSICPEVFTLTKLQQKILFWMQIFSSVEKLLLSLNRNNALLSSDIENTAVPNLSFLKEKCSLSARQIARLIKWNPRLITCKPEVVKTFAQRAEELGIPNSSGMFMYALGVVSCLNQSTIDAKQLYLKSFGLSHEEVTLMISKAPLVLTLSVELIGCKIEFLLKEAGCDKIDLVRYPALLSLSLEKRLTPRSFVRKILESKGLPVANRSFCSCMHLNEKRFVEKFVLPYEHAIPGLHQAYINAGTGENAVTELFRKFLS